MTAMLGLNQHGGGRPLRSRPPAGLGWVGQPRLLRGIASRDLTSYAEHLGEHGPRPTLTREALLAQLDAVALAGRGGAGFSLAAKIRSLRSGPDARPVVVVNGCEGEPASAKDAALLTRVPHLVLDGALAAAAALYPDAAVYPDAALDAGRALDPGRVLIAVSSPSVAAAVQRAVAARPDSPRFQTHLLPERYITGEARALISALNGGAATPPGRRVLPSESGVGGQPTLLSNAETFAQLAYLTRVGPAGFAEVGTRREPGTTLLTVSGAVARPGVMEVALGTPLSAVAEAVGAEPARAVVIGGYHGGWLSEQTLRSGPVPISRAGLGAVGATLGAGAVMFLGVDTCALGELTRVAQWLADQSAKNCGPCAFGLPALVQDLLALNGGSAGPAGPAGAAGPVGPVGSAGLAALDRHARMVAGRGACSHPDGAVRFLSSGLAALADEVRDHQAHGGCGRPVQGDLPL
ncbi:MAG: oxidoreductase [Frankiales bacterium]|nr:oxidoreductase [Frankiales bacterium]